jgi:hypothetical protein
LASDELPVVNVSPDTPVSSGAPLPQHGPQPLWQATYQLHPAQSGWITPTHRLALAIISVGMMALFSMIILTSTQNTSTGLIGVGIMCGSILLVNAVFNRGA